MVLFDTNFLAVPAQFKVDIFDEVASKVPGAHFATLYSVIEEVKKIKDKKASKLALMLVQAKGVELIKQRFDDGVATDDALLSVAVRNNAVLCTNDAVLRKKAEKQGVSVVFLRQKNRVEMR